MDYSNQIKAMEMMIIAINSQLAAKLERIAGKESSGTSLVESARECSAMLENRQILEAELAKIKKAAEPAHMRRN